MSREYVYSKLMYYFEYDNNKQILTIGFNGGRVTRFFGINAGLYKKFFYADSYGRFYLDHIKSKFESEIIHSSDKELSYSIYSNFGHNILSRLSSFYKTKRLKLKESKHSSAQKKASV